jgi:hypothetical protein
VIGLILGGANTLADDRERALALIAGRPHTLIACNHAGRDEPGPLDHWVSMHPELWKLWLGQRRKAGRPDPGQLWHARHKLSPLEESRAIDSWGGSSGLLCVAVAFELGLSRIIVAGVPMAKLASHYDDDKPWYEARYYWPMWEKHAGRMRDRVRSMSGWTAQLLGSPDGGWVDGGYSRPDRGAARAAGDGHPAGGAAVPADGPVARSDGADPRRA